MIKPFKPDHLTLIESDEKFQGVDEEAFAAAYAGHPGWTLVEDGRIVACGGIIPYWNGTAEIWIYPSIYVKNYPVSFHKTCKRFLEFNAQAYNRLQATVKADYMTGIKWAEHMGFVAEGVLQNYLGEDDYIMYARVNKCN